MNEKSSTVCVKILNEKQNKQCLLKERQIMCGTLVGLSLP